MAEGRIEMNEDIINKKIEMIEQSRQYMHRMIDEQYDEFIRQSQGISDDETEIDEEVFAPQMSM